MLGVTFCTSYILHDNRSAWNRLCHKLPHAYLINAWPPLFFLRGSIQPPERRKPASPFAGRSGHGLSPSPHTGLPCASRHLSVPHGFTIKGCSIPPHRCLHNLTVKYPYKRGKGCNNNACSQQGQSCCCQATSLSLQFNSFLPVSRIKNYYGQHHMFFGIQAEVF